MRRLTHRLHRMATDIALLFWLAILGIMLTCSGAWW